MFDLPHPLGPTTPVICSPMFTTARSQNDLNPMISIRLIRMRARGSAFIPVQLGQLRSACYHRGRCARSRRNLRLLATCAAIAVAARRQVSIRAHTDVRLGPVRKDYGNDYIVSGHLVDRAHRRRASAGTSRAGPTFGGRHRHAATSDRRPLRRRRCPAPAASRTSTSTSAAATTLDPAQVEPTTSTSTSSRSISTCRSRRPRSRAARRSPSPRSTAARRRSRLNVAADDRAAPRTRPTSHRASAVTAGEPAVHRHPRQPPVAPASADPRDLRRRRRSSRRPPIDATIELTTATATTFALDSTPRSRTRTTSPAPAPSLDDDRPRRRARDRRDRSPAAARSREAVTARRRQLQGPTSRAALGDRGDTPCRRCSRPRPAGCAPSRSTPIARRSRSPRREPVPVAFTMIAFVATAAVAFGFFAARTTAVGTRWMHRARRSRARARDAPHADPPAAWSCRGPAWSPRCGAPRSRLHRRGARRAPQSPARRRRGASCCSRGDKRRCVTAADGSFAFEDARPRRVAGHVQRAGHVTEHFTALIPHRGELRDARVDLVPVRERVFTLYRRAALPLLPNRGPVGHLVAAPGGRPRPRAPSRRARSPSSPTSSRRPTSRRALPDEAILPDAETRVEAAVREQCAGITPPTHRDSAPRARHRSRRARRGGPALARVRAQQAMPNKSAMERMGSPRRPAPSRRRERDRRAAARAEGPEPKKTAPPRRRRRGARRRGRRRRGDDGDDERRASTDREPPPADAEARAAYKAGLAKTRGGFVARLGQLFGKKKIDADVLGELEEVLFTADIGPRAADQHLHVGARPISRRTISPTPPRSGRRSATTSATILAVDAPPIDLTARSRSSCSSSASTASARPPRSASSPSRTRRRARRSLLAAGDTFRAAATEQLEDVGRARRRPGREGQVGQRSALRHLRRGQARRRRGRRHRHLRHRRPPPHQGRA